MAETIGVQAEGNRKNEASLRNQKRIHDEIFKKILDQGQAALDDARARAGTGGFQGSARAAFEAENSVRNLDLSNQEKQALIDKAVLTQELIEVEERRASLAENIQSSMSDAFMSLIDGTKSAKQAFADMAKSILANIARMIVEMMVLKMLQSSMPGLFGTPGSGSGSGASKILAGSGERYGGIVDPPRKYSQGGIARGRDSGYGAILHGTEAVVPLPNNRSIPVDLKGQQANNNSVTVNVSMGGGQGGDERSSSGNSQQAKQLGELVAAAVQSELHHQKRAGGILNPYGVT